MVNKTICWPEAPSRWSLEGGDTHVWVASLLTSPASLARFAAALAPAERERAAKFRFERDRNRFVTARGLLRAMLGQYLEIDPVEVQFAYGPHGKPTLAGIREHHDLHFNVAHSEALALFAISRAGNVGVDVERIRPLDDAEELAARFFSPRESAALRQCPEGQRLGAFFEIWTRKEAWLKAKGEGIAHSLDVQLPSKSSRWRLHDLAPASGFIGALALDLGSAVVGTSRCAVPACVQKAERFVQPQELSGFDCAAERGADGAARRPYLELGQHSDEAASRAPRTECWRWTTS
jgi:4'-phosphopantetheinyl transferase